MTTDKLIHDYRIEISALEFTENEPRRLELLREAVRVLELTGAFCPCHHCNCEKFNDCLDLETAIAEGYKIPCN